MGGSGLVPLLNSACCCCISLRLGSLIIGWYRLIFGALSLIFYLPLAYGFTSDISGRWSSGVNGARFIFDASVVVFVVLWLASGYLVFGIRKRRPGFVSTYLVLATLSIIFDIFFLALIKFTSRKEEMQRTYSKRMGEDLSAVFCDPWAKFVDLVISLYSQWVVYSYYHREMKQGFSPNSVGFVA